MAITRKSFFGDSQFKRYLVQIMRAFIGFQVKTGDQRDGKPRFLDIPVTYGDMSQVAAYLMSGGSDNTNRMPYLPIMSIYMTGLKQDNARRQSVQHSEKIHYIEMAKDPEGNPIVGQPGKKKTVERFMPVPYEMSLELAIWASNNDQLHQILEQILAYFNPEQELQLSNSAVDWTGLTRLFFDGEVRFEKVATEGTNMDPKYVALLGFHLTIWIGMPVKVYDTKYIYEVDVPILDLDRSLDFDSMNKLDGLVIRATDEQILEFEQL